MRYQPGVTPEMLRLLLGGYLAPRKGSEAAKRDPHYPRRPLTANRLTLSEETRLRGGHKSRRRTARCWS